MCRICVDYQLGKITFEEAWNNSYELQDKEHMQDVWVMLINDMIMDDPRYQPGD